METSRLPVLASLGTLVQDMRGVAHRVRREDLDDPPLGVHLFLSMFLWPNSTCKFYSLPPGADDSVSGYVPPMSNYTHVVAYSCEDESNSS